MGNTFFESKNETFSKTYFPQRRWSCVLGTRTAERCSGSSLSRVVWFFTVMGVQNLAKSKFFTQKGREQLITTDHRRWSLEHHANAS